MVALSPKHWLPVEANPEVMGAYAEKLGFGLAASGRSFVDVLGTDPAMLAMVPTPVDAVLLLFPVSAASEAHRHEEEAARTSASASASSSASSLPFFTQQTVDNACGTIGLIHVAAAMSTLYGGPIELARDSFLDKYLRASAALDPAARASALDSSEDLDAAHAEVALEGQSDVVDDTHNHFLALVRHGGILYELDGRKAAPIAHGATAPETFLQDAVRVIEQFMARDPTEIRFAMVGLGPTPPPED